MKMNYDDALKNVTELSELSPNNQKQTLVEVLCLTQSYIDITRLQSILPQEQYSKVLSSLETIGITTQEQLESEKCFFSVTNNQIQLKLVGFDERRNFTLCDIELGKIDLDNLLPIAKESIRMHNNATNIHSNSILQSAEIKSLLMHTQKAIGRVEKIKETGITYSELTENLDNFSELSDNEKLITTVQAMGMTQSWLKLDDLKHILPEEQYNKIVSELKDRLAMRYAHIDASEEKKSEAIEDDLAKESTFITIDKNGISLQRYVPYGQNKEPKLIDIHLTDLDLETLLPVVESCMETHEAYASKNTVWENSLLSAEQIKTVLAKAQHCIVKNEVKEQRNFIQKQVEKIKELIEKTKTFFKGKEKEAQAER